MKLDVPWGRGHITVECPPDLEATVVRRPAGGGVSPDALLTDALASPENSPALHSFLREYGEKLTVVVNDATRPTPTAHLLACLRRLHPNLLGPQSRGQRVMIATGAHGAGGREDLAHMLGPLLADVPASIILWHDASNPAAHDYLGTTTRGTPVHLDQAVTRASGLLVINSVEPHYFAGYTGGRKSLVPGCAGEGTISTNHRHALHPAAVALRLEGNPVHEDLEEAVGLLGHLPTFSVQVVLGDGHRIVSAHAGDLGSTFRAATAAADRECVVELSEPFDVVVAAVPHPMDYNLYQAQKGIDNGALAVKDSGTLILVSTCRHGVGGEAFFRVLSSAANPGSALEHIQQCWVLGYHKAARVAQVAKRVRLWGVTELEPSTLAAAFLQPFASLDSALAAARDLSGPGARVLFLLDAALTVPRVAVGENHRA